MNCLIGKKLLLLCLSSFRLLSPMLVFCQKTTISGYVRDASSKEALIGASVTISKSKMSSPTNQYGYFTVTLPNVDTSTVLFSFSGYAPVVKKFFGGKNIQLNIFLTPETNILNDVVVNSNRNADNVQKTQMGVTDVPIKSIKELPVLLGEHDILKTIQLLAGVQSGQEGTTGFYVRGGNSDQNLIQMDASPVIYKFLKH